MKLLFSFLISAMIFCSAALASGLSKPVQVGPKAIGMGGAFVGVADDPTAIYHNPAGMTQLKGYQIEVGIDALIVDEHYTPDQTAFPGAPRENAKSEFLPVPQFGFTKDLDDKVVLGLGVFFPHGNGGKFPNPSSNPFNPNEGRIYSMEIAPALAFNVGHGLSIGGTARIVRVSSSLKGQLFPAPISDTLDNIDVSGWGVGGSVGVFYKPCKTFSFGTNWRSKIEVDVSGDAAFATLGAMDASFESVLPMLVTSGVAVYPIDGLTIGVMYGFEANSQIKQYDVTLSGFPAPLPLSQNFDDSHTIHFGAEYWATSDIAVRAGYAKDLNESIPDTSMNRVVGDIAAHELSAGIAYKWSRYTFAGTWNARFGERDIPLTATNPSPGHYQAFVQSVSLAVQTTL
jgi:long-chain fatty acid transport protein